MSGLLKLLGQNGDNKLGISGGEADHQGENVISVEGVQDKEQVDYIGCFLFVVFGDVGEDLTTCDNQRHKFKHLVEHVAKESSDLLTASLQHTFDNLKNSKGKLEVEEPLISDGLYFPLQ